jgi:hypothetical protein
VQVPDDAPARLVHRAAGLHVVAATQKNARHHNVMDMS